MSARHRVLLLLSVLLVAALATPAGVAAQTAEPTSEVTIAKVWNYDLAGPLFEPSVISVTSIRIQIDDDAPQDVAPGTTLTLQAGQVVTMLGEELDGALPDGCELLIGLQAPYTVNEQEPTWTLNATNTVICPHYTVTFEKVWDVELARGLVGDEGIDVAFEVDRDGQPSQASPGDTWDLDLGETVEVVNEMYDEAMLPESCELIADLGEPYTATDEDPFGVITVTNTVICAEESVYAVTFEKVWDLEHAAGYVEEGDIEVSFEVVVGDGIIEVFPGETLELFPGESAEVIGEWLDGELPDECSMTVDHGALFTPSDEDPAGTITVTNTVTCEAEPGPAPEPEPEAAPVRVSKLPTTCLPLGVLMLLGLGLATGGGVLVRRR
jgi:hypothetical protein